MRGEAQNRQHRTLDRGLGTRSDDSGVHLKSISTQLHGEAIMDDVSDCDKAEGKTNNLGGRSG